jgi:hypothetical protein
MVIFGEAHLRRIIFTYAAYYNQSRPHLALYKDAPFHPSSKNYRSCLVETRATVQLSSWVVNCNTDSRLMSPAYVRPYAQRHVVRLAEVDAKHVKAQKNDERDAEAIAEAAADYAPTAGSPCSSSGPIRESRDRSLAALPRSAISDARGLEIQRDANARLFQAERSGSRQADLAIAE